MKSYSAYQKHIRSSAGQWFRKKGFALSEKHEHVLRDKDDWPNNIVLPEVVDYIDNQPNLKTHRDAHNGSSSQALAFNLAGPLITRNDLAPLRLALENQGISIGKEPLTAAFEYEDTSIFSEISGGQPTSIDLALGYENQKPHIIIEVKLTEQEFGKCSQVPKRCDGANPAYDFQMCYLHNIGHKYWQLMKKYGFIQGKIATDKKCILAEHYQFFREVHFALESNGVFVLLHDDRNPKFNTLFPKLKALVPVPYQSRIFSVTIGQIVEQIKLANRHEWIAEFEEKYGLN